MHSVEKTAVRFRPRRSGPWTAGWLALVLSAAGGTAQAASGADPDERKPCSVAEVKADWRKAVKSGVVTALSLQFSSAHCGSLRAVMARLADSTVVGGRKLEGGKPFDQRGAEQQLAAAGTSQEYQRVLQAELAGEADPARRLLIEAATLHEFGHYLARDLILQRLQAGSGA